MRVSDTWDFDIRQNQIFTFKCPEFEFGVREYENDGCAAAMLTWKGLHGFYLNTRGEFDTRIGHKNKDLKDELEWCLAKLKFMCNGLEMWRDVYPCAKKAHFAAQDMHARISAYLENL